MSCYLITVARVHTYAFTQNIGAIESQGGL